MEFIPNWKRNGHKTMEEGMMKAIKDLMGSPSCKGLDGESTVSWRDISFKIGLGKKAEKKKKYG